MNEVFESDNYVFPPILKSKCISWQIWYFQNIFIFIAGILFFPNFFLTVGFPAYWMAADFIGGVINLLVFLAFLLDIFAISILSSTSLFERKTSNLYLILSLCGLCCIFLLVIWRLPWILQGPYYTGFGIRISPMTDQMSKFFLIDLHEQDLLLWLLLGNILLFFFLIINDLSNKSSNMKFQDIFVSLDIGTLFGLTNLIGTLLVGLYVSEVMEIMLIFQLGVVVKLFITPGLGMRTARKYFSLSSVPIIKGIPDLDESSLKNLTIIQWLKNSWKIKKPRRIFPNKNMIIILGILSVSLLIIPFSPFSADNLLPKPLRNISINRYAENPEAREILEYVESLTLNLSTICYEFRYPYEYDRYLMTNDTLNYYLNKVNRGFGPSNRLSWNISLSAFDYPELNYSNFPFYGISYFNCFVWWDNNTQFSFEAYDYLYSQDLIQLRFSNFSLPVKWVSFGEFDYSVRFEWIEVKQLLFLNKELEIICFAHFHSHAVS